MYKWLGNLLLKMKPSSWIKLVTSVCVMYYEREKQSIYILRALLVSGLSPRIWRIWTSEEATEERNSKMSFALRRIELDLLLSFFFFFFSSTLSFSLLFWLLNLILLSTLETSLEPVDKHEDSSLESMEHVERSHAEFIIKYVGLTLKDPQMTWERRFLTICVNKTLKICISSVFTPTKIRA